MRRGKYLKKCRRTSPAAWIILVLVLLSLSFGGARAYLSISGDSVTNSFVIDNNPGISVGSDYRVTVTAEYAVYLRAAVVPSWKSNSTNNILAAIPSERTDYTVGNDWVYSGGYYYYTQAVTKNQPTTTPIVTSSTGTREGYTLTMDVAVQAIQAIGTTDDGNIKAVVDAWGVDPSTLGNNRN